MLDLADQVAVEGENSYSAIKREIGKMYGTDVVIVSLLHSPTTAIPVSARKVSPLCRSFITLTVFGIHCGGLGTEVRVSGSNFPGMKHWTT